MDPMNKLYGQHYIDGRKHNFYHIYVAWVNLSAKTLVQFSSRKMPVNWKRNVAF